jgi:hypothetical protein
MSRRFCECLSRDTCRRYQITQPGINYQLPVVVVAVLKNACGQFGSCLWTEIGWDRFHGGGIGEARNGAAGFDEGFAQVLQNAFLGLHLDRSIVSFPRCIERLCLIHGGACKIHHRSEVLQLFRKSAHSGSRNEPIFMLWHGVCKGYYVALKKCDLIQKSGGEVVMGHSKQFRTFGTELPLAFGRNSHSNNCILRWRSGSAGTTILEQSAQPMRCAR